ALYDAADDDSATGGPDPVRRTWPLIVLITAEGLVRLTDEEAAEASRAVLSQRGERPDGPGAGPL
ncbi:proteasome subunit beta, partial [Streptomyces klenkii]